jgi:galactose mutarotase-like enzyme
MLRMQTDAHGAYFGCIVGRVANRIEGACFSDPSDSKTAPNVFHLEANDGANHLHGGSQHWGRQEWRIEQRPSPENPTAVFCRRSAEWEAGYPSELDTRITYALDPVPKHGACSGGLGDAPGDREAHGSGLGLPVARLRVTMEATATGRTPINLVQHTHWNLCGLRAVNNVRPVLMSTHFINCAVFER